MKKLLTILISLLATVSLVACVNIKGESTQSSYEDLPSHLGNQKPNTGFPPNETALMQDYFLEDQYFYADKPLYDSYTKDRTKALKEVLDNMQYKTVNLQNSKEKNHKDIANLYGDAYFEYGMIDDYVKDKSDKKELKKGYLKVLNNLKELYDNQE